MNKTEYRRMARNGFKLSEEECPDARLDEMWDESERRIEKFKRDNPITWERAEEEAKDRYERISNQ